METNNKSTFRIVNCVCGTEPIIEAVPTDPVCLDYKIKQVVYCPNCGIKVEGKKGYKMWNALIRVIERTNKQNEIVKAAYAKKKAGNK